MKPKTRYSRNCLPLAAVFAAVITPFTASNLQAAALTWTGGNGDWQNGVAGGWSAVWANSPADTATFNGPGGIVTLKSTITTGAADLAFTSGNYTLQSDGATERIINLGDQDVTLGNGVTTTIGSNVTLNRSIFIFDGNSKTTSTLNFNSGSKITGSTNILTIRETTFNFNTGASLTNGTSIVLGTTANGATMNIGGTVNIAGLNSNFVLGNGNVTSTVNLKVTSGGSITLTNTSSTTSGGIRVGGANGATTGIIDLEGGTVTTNRFYEGPPAGHSSTLNLHGGTMKALNSSNIDRPEFLAVDNVFVKSGGAIFDTDGKSITVAKAMLTDTVSTGGGLSKNGNGTLTLAGANTYTGTTNVNAGTLSLGAAASIIQSASLALGSSATLNTSAQATYAIPATQPVTFSINPAGNGSSGNIVASGLDITNAAITLSATATLDDPVYVLATYSGTLTGALFASVSGLPSGYSLNYAYETNKIALVRPSSSP